MLKRIMTQPNDFEQYHAPIGPGSMPLYEDFGAIPPGPIALALEREEEADLVDRMALANIYQNQHEGAYHTRHSNRPNTQSYRYGEDDHSLGPISTHGHIFSAIPPGPFSDNDIRSNLEAHRRNTGHATRRFNGYTPESRRLNQMFARTHYTPESRRYMPNGQHSREPTNDDWSRIFGSEEGVASVEGNTFIPTTGGRARGQARRTMPQYKNYCPFHQR
jgi:hypothetical protein